MADRASDGARAQGRGAVSGVRTESAVEAMREGGRLLAEILGRLVGMVKEGVSAWELEEAARKWIAEAGARPSFLGYRGYPYALCVSVNEEIVHGFPEPEKVFQAGDVVKVDCGVYWKGFHTDSAYTVCIPPQKPEVCRFVRRAKETLLCTLQRVRSGVRTGDVGQWIQASLEPPYRVMRDLFGHGVGAQLHEDPLIPNFGPAGRGPVLREGMTVAVEVMVCMGKPKLRTAKNRWTNYTVDRSQTAHFEHTILVTEGLPEILTWADWWQQDPCHPCE